MSFEVMTRSSVWLRNGGARPDGLTNMLANDDDLWRRMIHHVDNGLLAVGRMR